MKKPKKFLINTIAAGVIVLLLSACSDSIKDSQSSDGEQQTSEIAKDEKNPTVIPGVGRPDYKNLHVVGAIGSGTISSQLKLDGREFTSSSKSQDAHIVDSSVASPEEIKKAITEALENKKEIIVDGVDNKAHAEKLSNVMLDIVGMDVTGAVAYSLHINSLGNLTVTPLLTINDEKGTRKFDQVQNYFNLTHQAK